MKKLPFYFLIGTYLLTRFLNLTSLPIFNDEAIYLHWGQIMVNAPDQAFFSLFDGKPPLVLWLYGYFQNLPLDPLVAGRLVSILFGLGTLAGILQVTRLLAFPQRAQIIAGILYITSPLTLFFDRMAILDSPISTVFIWVLFLSFRLSSSRSDLSPGQTSLGVLLLGLIQAGGLWIKGTANLFLYLPFIIPILTIFLMRDFRKAKREFFVFLSSFILAQVLFLPIRFQPLFATFQKREGDFLLPLAQAIQPPTWLPHLSLASLTFFIYLSPLVLFFAILGFIRLWQKDHKICLVLLLFVLFPLVFEIFTARYFLSRYFLFTLLPILVLGAFGLEQIKKWVNPTAIVTLALPVVISFLLLVNPLLTLKTLAQNKTLASDLEQYFTGWTSGYGVKETADWLKNESQKGPIVVLVRADSGNPEDGMFVYLAKEKNILLAQAGRKPTQEELAPLAKFPIYFVSRGEQYLGMKEHLIEKKTFPKPEGPEFIGVYQIKAQQ